MPRPCLLASIALLTACSGSPGNESAGAPAGSAPAAPAEAANAVAHAGAAAPAGAALATYLPAPGRHDARAMVLAPPAEAVALRDRMAAAIIRNEAWFEAYAARHPQGELPWHANLGIGEADYLRYLALTRQIRLSERARVRLTVTRRPDGGLALAADGAAAALTGILLYPDRGRAETPRGPLGTSRVTGNDAADSPLGRWQGAEWSNRGIHATRLVSLSAGRRAAGDMLLYFSYGPSDAETVILLYPAAAAGAAR